MAVDVQALAEVVVVGYGTQNKKDVKILWMQRGEQVSSELTQATNELKQDLGNSDKAWVLSKAIQKALTLEPNDTLDTEIKQALVVQDESFNYAFQCATLTNT